MFCLVGLAPPEGLDQTRGRGRGRERKVELEEPLDTTTTPDWVSVEQPGAFCEISILDHDYYSIKTKTGIQLKTSVSFEFLSPELRTVIDLIFPDQRDVPRLPGPEPTA